MLARKIIAYVPEVGGEEFEQIGSSAVFAPAILEGDKLVVEIASRLCLQDAGSRRRWFLTPRAVRSLCNHRPLTSFFAVVIEYYDSLPEFLEKNSK
jgi:hypothetical protein